MCVMICDINALMAYPVSNRRGAEAHVDEKRYMAVPLRYNNDKPDESRIIKGFQGFKAVF